MKFINSLFLSVCKYSCSFCIFEQTLYNSVIEEKITIEQVNTMGARLAKEAKVCIFFNLYFVVEARG